ncbi:MAG TPA: methyltransferase domain-containing protein [Gaiellaceae bacterium]|jgi:2-polyprenyl-3-methyl-5-hydroxy-6-metoxy-1,4-benzoquinol methylase|nr:methyltransferase domain-containing protein [Gaiellaceae bacterium]
MGEATYDEARAEAFAGRMLDMLNSGALMVMTSVGHRTGLFDALAELDDATSHELAEAAELDERYVREWLGAMVTGRIVEIDPETHRYSLPAEHAAWLTRAASPDNLAVEAQWITTLSAVEDDILECFQNGGGVPYQRFERFHEVMAEESAQTVLSVLFSHILPLVPGMAERLEEGASLLDLGCGRGRALVLLGERFPASSFVGYDLSGDAIAFASAQAAERGLENVRFEQRDLSTFDLDAEPESFDFVTTFDAVHDQARPLAMLRGIRRALRSDGVYLMQDIQGSSHVHENIDHPGAPLLYMISCMHCMTVSLAQGGDGLGAMWGEQKARELLAEAGFSSVDVHLLEHDPFNAYFVVRP